MPHADLSLAVPAVFFGSIGTTGYRCTSTRRLYLHRQIAKPSLVKLRSPYSTLQPGDPLTTGTLLGPMHNKQGLSIYSHTIHALRTADAEILTGGARYHEDDLPSSLKRGHYVRPTIAIPQDTNPLSSFWSTEVFAPILNVAVFDELEEAIGWNNTVPQGLSSSLWTRDIRILGK